MFRMDCSDIFRCYIIVPTGKKKRFSEDVTLLMNKIVVEHLDKKNGYGQTFFIDFRPVFNILKSVVIITFLNWFQVSPITYNFLQDCLFNWRQRSRINGIISGNLTTNTGGPRVVYHLLSYS